MITELLHIDNTFRSVTDRKKQHQLVLSEKVDAYFAWAKQKYSQATHNSTSGKALAYSINQEEYLRVFLSDRHIPMDNNYAEQAIRAFTIGRKNFVMIEYFNLLLTESPRHMDDKDLRFIDDLLPWSPRVLKNAQADTKNLDFQCAYPFCKICSIPAKMWEFLIPITHV